MSVSSPKRAERAAAEAALRARQEGRYVYAPLLSTREFDDDFGVVIELIERAGWRLDHVAASAPTAVATRVLAVFRAR